MKAEARAEIDVAKAEAKEMKAAAKADQKATKAVADAHEKKAKAHAKAVKVHAEAAENITRADPEDRATVVARAEEKVSEANLKAEKAMIKADEKSLKVQVDAAADKAPQRPRPSRCAPKRWPTCTRQRPRSNRVGCKTKNAGASRHFFSRHPTKITRRSSASPDRSPSTSATAACPCARACRSAVPGRTRTAPPRAAWSRPRCRSRSRPSG